MWARPCDVPVGWRARLALRSLRRILEGERTMTAKSRPLISAAGRLAFGGCSEGRYEPYSEPPELTARRARLERAADNARKELTMAKNKAGVWCCECDYCAHSPCDGTPAGSIFFTDNNWNYISFCDAHVEAAQRSATAYLAAHPGVAIDHSDDDENGRG
jgi:hypothetical protein